MKLSNAVLAVTFAAFVATEAASNKKPQQATRRRLLQTTPCILTQQEAQYEDEDHERSEWVCELQGSDVEQAHAMFVSLEGLGDQELEDSKVISGKTTFQASGTEILPNGKLLIPSNSKRQFGSAPPRGPGSNIGNGGGDSDNTNRKRGLQAVQKTVLAVRINAPDVSTTPDVADISDSIFGTTGDSINLKERFDSCSYGQLTFEGYEGTTSSKVEIPGTKFAVGVVEVDIDENVIGATNPDIIRDAALTVATELLGDLPSQFDHVMLCIPPGTIGGWIAYAYANSWLSVYNDEWCTYPSAQVHEIGHNLNLAHAGEGGNAYGDQSGFMGYSYSADEGPAMCFNPAKSWQLGWYSDKRTTVNQLNDGAFATTLVGIDDYQSEGDTFVNVKVENGITDLFIGFNRQKGINSGTKEAANKVTIQTQGSGFSPSSLVAELAENEEYTIQNYQNSGIDAVVKVGSIDIASTPSTATIDIFLFFCEDGDCGPHCGTCCDNNDCTGGELKCATGTATCENDGTCSYDESSCKGIFEFTLVTDSWPGESSWDVKDECDGNKVVLSGGSYLSKLTTYFERTEIGNSRFKLTINDSWGDGICCSQGEGSFAAKYNGVEVASGGEFGSTISATFGSCSSESLSSAPSFESVSHSVCENFAVHARTTVTFDGVMSTIHGGDVGVFPGTSITGSYTFKGGQVVLDSNAFATSVTAAHAAAMEVRVYGIAMAIEIGGLTFTPGTYRSGSAINFAYGTVVTLDGNNEANPVFLFQSLTTLVTAADTSFILKNGAKAENVYWALGTAATLGANSVVEGSILAGTAITFGTKSQVHGCALAQTAVTFESEGHIEPNHYIDLTLYIRE